MTLPCRSTSIPLRWRPGRSFARSGTRAADSSGRRISERQHQCGCGAQLFALGPRFGRSKVTTKIGIEPTELNIEIYAEADDLVGTMALAEAVRIGLFDGATVELDRLFAPPQAAGSGTLDTSLGVLLWFYGRVAECDVGRSRIAIRVKSLMNLLAVQQMPRRLYQASCGHVFGDTMCGYDRVVGEERGRCLDRHRRGDDRRASRLDPGADHDQFCPQPRNRL